MLFNSVSFLLFFIVVLFLHYIAPHKFRWILLLAASLLFYAAFVPELVLLMLFVVFVNYLAALLIRSEKFSGKRKILIFALLISFGILFAYKYSMFFNGIVFWALDKFRIDYPYKHFSIILPMGISFYTFQSVGYLIDVFRKDIEPERNFFKLSLFITFFPQLVAGPIERTSALLPQLMEKRKFSMENIIMGFKFMIYGFFKKVVIGDRIAVIVNSVFNAPDHYGGLSLIIASFLFTVQIYCDFSGYSDIAVGSAKMLGINLMENFKSPFFAKSVKEVWRRWHISLSSWFKDYLYFPLGGSRVSKPRHYINTFVTFLVSGLWHGANWTFMAWGAMHGIALVIEDILRKPVDKVFTFLRLNNFFLTKIVKTAFTFIFFCFAFIMFRANNISDFKYIVSNLLNDAAQWSDKAYVYNSVIGMGLNLFEISISVVLIALLFVVDFISKNENIHGVLLRRNGLLQFMFYFAVTVIVLSLGVYYNSGAFIYFQF